MTVPVVALVVAKAPVPGLAKTRLAAAVGAQAAADISAAVPFYGRHQAGIVTPAQDRLHFVAFDVITNKRDDLVNLLKAWTVAAARMTAGHDAGTVGAVNGSQARSRGQGRHNTCRERSAGRRQHEQLPDSSEGHAGPLTAWW